MKTFKSIPGTFDVLPDGHSSGGDTVAPSRMWRFLESVVHDTMARYGAGEIRTPILEPTDLIARGIGALSDIVTKEMFAFERGSTHYVMRPEVTAPVMRAYLQHNLAQKGGTQRLYYIGPCFRAERPQKGRYRQFHQFGLEVIGSEDARADAEAIASLRDVLSGLGLQQYTLRINSLGDADSRPAYKQALVEYLTPMADELSDISRKRLESNPLRILDTKSEKEQALLKDAPLLSDFIDSESRDHHEQVKAYLSDVGIDFVEDPFLVRGLDYYSRTAFEFESPLLGAQSSIAGGGRYDLLSKEVGSKQIVPAVGFAAGMERILLACAAEGIAGPEAARVDDPAPTRPRPHPCCCDTGSSPARERVECDVRRTRSAPAFQLQATAIQKPPPAWEGETMHSSVRGPEPGLTSGRLGQPRVRWICEKFFDSSRH